MTHVDLPINRARVPQEFCSKAAREVLMGDKSALVDMCYWADTDEGLEYWNVRFVGRRPLTARDAEQILVWITLAGEDGWARRPFEVRL